MHDGLYQKAQETSCLLVNVAEYLIMLSFNLSVEFQGGSARLTTRTPRVSYVLGLWILDFDWGTSLHHRLLASFVHYFDKTMNCQSIELQSSQCQVKQDLPFWTSSHNTEG